MILEGCENEGESVAEPHVGNFRIAFCIDSLDVGGAEKQLVGLMRNLKMRGHQIALFTVWRRGALLDRVIDMGIPVYGCLESEIRSSNSSLGALKELMLGLFRLHKEIRAFRPQLVQTWLPRSQAIFMLLALLGGVRVRIASRRGSYEAYRRNARGRLFLQYLNWLSSATTVNSEMELSEAQHESGQHDLTLKLIKNGIDIAERRANPGLSPLIAVVLANFLPYKGHADLVRAVALMDPSLRFRVVLHGTGPERGRIEKLISELNLRSWIEVGGFTDQPVKILQGAQLLVLPSHTEGLPNAILEAMAVGLPVVATAVGAVESIVVDGVSGVVVPPHDPEALSRAMTFMVENPDIRAQMGEAARVLIAPYSWSGIVAEYEQLYDELLLAKCLQ